jgi:hypothetical protein
MSEERVYYIDLRLGMEYTGEDIPCEDTILTPIKQFIKQHMKAYKKTCRLTVMNTRITEVEYDEEIENDEGTN